jgi:hypothetical protein
VTGGRRFAVAGHAPAMDGAGVDGIEVATGQATLSPATLPSSTRASDTGGCAGPPGEEGVDEHLAQWPVVAICAAIELSERTYYAARARPASVRSVSDWS